MSRLTHGRPSNATLLGLQHHIGRRATPTLRSNICVHTSVVAVVVSSCSVSPEGASAACARGSAPKLASEVEPAAVAR